MERLLSEDWLPKPANVKRVISHWTGGGYGVSANELQLYHFLISGDGKVHRCNTSVGQAAAHTRRFNTGSVGVSICSMLNAKENGPFGNFPMKQSQWDISARVTAEICHRYNLLVTPRTVLQHGEVRKRYPEIFTSHNTYNATKWDCNRLPFAPELSVEQVQEDYRNRVRDHLKALTRKAIPVGLNGAALVDNAGKPVGYVEDGRAWVWARPLLIPMQLELVDVESTHMQLRRGSQSINAAAHIEAGRGYVAIGDLRQFTGVTVKGDGTFVEITA